MEGQATILGQRRPDPLIGPEGELLTRSPDNRYEVRRADIVHFPAGAIVNVINGIDFTPEGQITASSIYGGETLPRSILAAAGDRLRTYCLSQFPNGLAVGEAVMTPSFEMPNCWYLIHTNAPKPTEERFHYERPYKIGTTRQLNGAEKVQLAGCYTESLKRAISVQECVDEIAFPTIGVGVNNINPRESAVVAVKSVDRFFNHRVFGKGRRKVIRKVTFVIRPRDELNERIFVGEFNRYFNHGSLGRYREFTEYKPYRSPEEEEDEDNDRSSRFRGKASSAFEYLSRIGHGGNTQKVSKQYREDQGGSSGKGNGQGKRSGRTVGKRELDGLAIDMYFR